MLIKTQTRTKDTDFAAVFFDGQTTFLNSLLASIQKKDRFASVWALMVFLGIDFLFSMAIFV